MLNSVLAYHCRHQSGFGSGGFFPPTGNGKEPAEPQAREERGETDVKGRGWRLEMEFDPMLSRGESNAAHDVIAAKKHFHFSINKDFRVRIKDIVQQQDRRR